MKNNNTDSPIKRDDTPDNIRREFLKKFGKYAASTPAMTFTLLSTYSSKAVGSTNNAGNNGGRDAIPYNHGE